MIRPLLWIYFNSFRATLSGKGVIVLLSQSEQSVSSREGASCAVDKDVLSGEACVKCGFKCIEGCS